MTTSNSGAPAPVPEFDVVVLGRSFASRRSATRLHDELRLAVHEAATVDSAHYDDIDHRWEIRVGRRIASRAKYVVDGDGSVPLHGRDGALLASDSGVVQGFPNLFRTAGGKGSDPIDYPVKCIGYMRTYGHDYVERRPQTLVADDDFPELSFDRPAPQVWVC
ncbi:hypothetical protein [Rhodococcus chondri]|uniref:Uncharacterized protein n=1 Tax=Rhodococcus chondri TaxID=3065941 RepID=A0ABU7JRZ0_9NOCA|nr:hypothetical protein [Rhodococcus sp. CC-R104]MEE2032792.1 hypothetical protein [Rhodococcus sp. CC-R104]